MLPPRRALLLPPLAFLLLVAPPLAAQEETPAVPDSIAPSDLERLRPVVDPRVTLLGDTLASADTTRPRFAALREFYPDSAVDPYTIERPGASPEWVLTGEELLGRGAFSLLDVLESETLALGQDLGGGGTPAFLVAPGGGHVAVFVDGVPSGGPLSVQWDLRQIALEGIERVAWYPGPQTAAWGAGATGGVLSITTRRSLAPASRSLLAFSVGTFDVETFSGRFGRPVTDSGRVFLGANFDSSDGLFGTGDFTRNQFVVKAGWSPASGHDLEVSRLSDDFSGEAARRNLTGTESRDRSTLHALYRAGAGPVRARARVYRLREAWDENFAVLELPGLAGEGETDGVAVDLEGRWGPVSAWLGGRRERSDIDSGHPAFLRADGSSILEPPAEGEEEGAARIVDPRETTEWAGGGGFGGAGEPLAVSAAARHVDPGDAAEAGTAWQIDAVARPLPDLTLRGFAGRGVRAPSPLAQALLARLADEGTEVHPGRPADPRALESWTGWRLDAAWSRAGWRVAGGAFGGSADGAFLWLPPGAWLSFDRGGFDVFRLAEPGFNTFDVLDLDYTGLQTELTVPLPWGLRGRLWARRTDLTAADSGERVPYLPRSQALGQVRYARRFFPSRDLLVEARVAGRYQGERTTLRGEAFPDYLVADALLQATVVNFTIFLSWKNLFGQVYRADDAFDLPGREGFFGVNWRFHD